MALFYLDQVDALMKGFSKKSYSKFGLFDFGFEINNNMDPGFYLIDYFRKAKQEFTTKFK